MAINNDVMVGKIIKSIGGLYTVKSFDSIMDCKARGIFRKDNISPVVGDMVEVNNGAIEKILPRKNYIVRPPLANLDSMVFVVSMAKPTPNLSLLDKFIAVCEYKNIVPVVAITKIDLANFKNVYQVYSSIGLRVFIIDYNQPQSIDSLKEYLSDKVSAFTGNSGAGKSTLLNAIDSTLNIPTGEVSEKLGRGKHTTRLVELLEVNDGLIADTPGFSSLEINIPAKEIKKYYSDFNKPCKYRTCTHVKEDGCEIIKMVENGKIPKWRYENYLKFMEETKYESKRFNTVK